MKNLNFPNLLTFSRILLVPVFSYYFWIGRYETALLIFLGAGLTDIIDGTLARWLQCRTALGAFLDPAADKFLMTVTFIVLGLKGSVPLWLTGLVISRDLYIVFGYSILKSKNKHVPIKPSRLSKLNTFFQLLTILSAFTLSYAHASRPPLLEPYINNLGWLLKACILLVVCMTFATGIQYTKIGLKLLKAN